METYEAYYWGSPCIVGFYWTKQAVKKRIEDAGYCEAPPPPPEEETPTTLTLSAPSSVVVGVPFTISGRLTFREGGVDYPLQGRTIELSYNGVSLGTATTGSDGTYSKSVTIPDVGTYTLMANYAGESGLTSAQISMRLSAAPLTPISALLPLAIGAGLIIASRP